MSTDTPAPVSSSASPPPSSSPVEPVLCPVPSSIPPSVQHPPPISAAVVHPLAPPPPLPSPGVPVPQWTSPPPPIPLSTAPPPPPGGYTPGPPFLFNSRPALLSVFSSAGEVLCDSGRRSFGGGPGFGSRLRWRRTGQPRVSVFLVPWSAGHRIPFISGRDTGLASSLGFDWQIFSLPSVH
ncbi:uncharacterized protein M6B38_249755 [Iris pallida]|uniref:Uncharacterized protein n=1 Tax=Iris pallida TaxID=29817 RepID=A0AAX6IL48_IRIPA|nr:uncharacterized protein M6B38_249755 [Iris pallida]